MKREDVDKLLGWAREAQKVFEESGETDFEELRRRESVKSMIGLRDQDLTFAMVLSISIPGMRR